MDEFDYAEATAVSVVGPYVVLVTFADGTRRRIDLEALAAQHVGDELRDDALVIDDQDAGTLARGSHGQIRQQEAGQGELTAKSVYSAPSSRTAGGIRQWAGP